MIKEMAEKLRTQSIVRLRLDGSTVGLRCTRYYPDKDQFGMYDFYLEDLVSNRKLYDFLKGISSKLTAVDLISVGDKLVTQEEQRMGVEAVELTSVARITSVVQPMVELYERRYIK